jgi:integrase
MSKTYDGVIERNGTRGTTYSIRYIDASGRRRFETLGKAPEWSAAKASKERSRRMLRAEDEGYVQPDGKARFEPFARDWQQNYRGRKGSLKRSTAASYRTIVEAHLIPEFGPMFVAKITDDAIERYRTRKLRDGASARTVNSHVQCLNLIMRHALKRKLIATNPVDLIDPLAEERADEPVLTPETAQKIDAAFASLILAAPKGVRRENLTTARVIFNLALYTGLRRGEILGLKWSAVDLDSRYLNVRETFVRAGFDTPKSEAGRRKVGFGPALAKMLREHKVWSAYSGADELCVPNARSGRPFDIHTFGDLFTEAREQAGVPYLRPFHGLRHSSITNAAATGMDVWELRTRAGHSTVQITERYVHLAKVEFDNDGGDALEARMTGAK